MNHNQNDGLLKMINVVMGTGTWVIAVIIPCPSDYNPCEASNFCPKWLNFTNSFSLFPFFCNFAVAINICI